MRRFIIKVFVIIVLVPYLPAMAASHRSLRNIDHLFELVDIDREGDDYYLTVVNSSNRAFDDFLIIVEGVDISDVTVYREEIEVDFMEGQSERSFRLPNVAEQVFKIHIQVFDRAPVAF